MIIKVYVTNNRVHNKYRLPVWNVVNHFNHLCLLLEGKKLLRSDMTATVPKVITHKLTACIRGGADKRNFGILSERFTGRLWKRVHRVCITRRSITRRSYNINNNNNDFEKEETNEYWCICRGWTSYMVYIISRIRRTACDCLLVVLSVGFEEFRPSRISDAHRLRKSLI